MKLLKKEEYPNKVYDLVGDEYSVLEEYIDSKTKLLTIHNSCGHMWKISPNKFKAGRRCPKCGEKKRVYNLGKYYKKKELIEINESDVKKEKILLKTKKYKEKIFDKFGNVYSILGKYDNSHKHILTRCNICNFEWMIMPMNLQKGHGCPKCAKNRTRLSLRKTLEKFKEEVFVLTGGEYEVIGNYENGMTKTLMKHILCGHEWESIPCNFLNGRRCPKCLQSRGEQEIEKFLKSKGMFFVRQKTFDCCKYKNNLFFDFYIPSVNACIEFQGEQHYKDLDFFKKCSFEERLQKDSIKRKYCIENDIFLIEIPYWDIKKVKYILEEKIPREASIEQRTYEI